VTRRPYAQRVFFVYILAPLVTFLLNGCVSLQPRLWPPAAGERTYPVYVSLDTWHGMIGFPSNSAIKPAASVPKEQWRTDLAKAERFQVAAELSRYSGRIGELEDIDIANEL